MSLRPQGAGPPSIYVLDYSLILS
uniref:Uncharacterized protein n=1 Tax=Arundo donax TaxID=35708 RepID=A0A0A9C8U3_ARUDO